MVSLLVVVPFSLLLLILVRWILKLRAVPATMCGCGRATCRNHTMSLDELHREMWRLGRLNEENDKEGRDIQDRLDTELNKDPLQKKQAANIAAFIEIMNVKHCVVDHLRLKRAA
jgi:hypothetical protein